MNVFGIVGAGGFGREVMPIAEETLRRLSEASNTELFYVVDKIDKEKTINGVKAISTEHFLSLDAENLFFNVAIGDSNVRERIANEFVTKGCLPFDIRAGNSTVCASNTIGIGSILCPYVTITVNAQIGKFFHANIYSYVAHDCIIGDYVTFAPKVCCNGNVVINDHAYIGTGAVIKQGTPGHPIIIGEGAIVGMGAVVTKSIPPHTIVVGNPAEPIKKKG